MNPNYVISDELIDKFRIKYEFDLAGYIDDMFFFIQYQYPDILNFYLGNIENAENQFISLNGLLDKSNLLDNLLRESKNDFKTYEDWEFIDYVTDIREKIITISKIYKFVRSSKVQTNFASELKYEYNLGQNETLEKVSRIQVSSDSPDNDWINIAKENDLREIDYDAESGNRILLSIKLNSEALGITSIIDSVEGVKVLGLDINRKVNFVNEDLEVLTYSDTFRQCVEILLSLFKEQIPEFPSIGRSRTIGQNMNVFSFNSITRELTETISSDDSIVDFSILDIKNDFANGQIFVSCSLRSRLDLITVDKILST